MTTLINIGQAYRGVLTTEHSASNYGIPVIVIDGQPYGPADRIEIGEEMRPIGELDILLDVRRVGDDVVTGGDIFADAIVTAEATHIATETAWTEAGNALAAWRAQLASAKAGR